MYKNEYITLPEGKICFYAWEAENPFCVLQLCHGMSEHLGRYDEFASALAAAGITVCGTDHPGHGKSDGTRGHFSDKNGWDYLISANLACAKKIKEDYPDLPKALMGHSMGSFIARYIAAYFPDTASAYIFMGTAGRNPVLFAGKTLAAVRSVFGHRRRPDNVINNLCFGAYAKGVKNSRTSFDWLSADENEVDKYIEDENCGFPFTAAGFAALFHGLGKVSGKKWAKKLDKNKPYLLLAGTDDPVGNYAKGVVEVYNNMCFAGVKDVDIKLYEGGRHETLNDSMRKEVTADVIEFLGKKMR